jgi:chromosome segregation ATPase
MADDNNNINELDVNDDDTTAELEIFCKTLDEQDTEASAKTSDSEKSDNQDQSRDLSVSRLESNLRSRKKVIGRLQFDIEQLHAKWRGLEAEVGARESQTVDINKELSDSIAAIAQKDSLLEKRDRQIEGLKDEVRQRDESYSLQKNRLDELELAVINAAPDTLGDDQATAGQNSQLRRTEEYADSIRQRTHDLIEKNSRAEREVDSLSTRLTEAGEHNVRIKESLSSAELNIERLQSTLDEVEKLHDKEIRVLRFELGDAQNTVVQTEEYKDRLVSDLEDVKSFNDELELMLRNAEEKSSERVEQLEKEVALLARKADNFEQKLTAKGEAISILLAELAEKSDQNDSNTAIENFIQDIDDRLTEKSPGADNVSRVLLGTIDDQTLRFPLFKNRLTIGRTNDNDIQLDADYVSRRHAVIQTDGDVTRIIDWGSRNGVQVNSSKITEHFLGHGDVIVIGNARFRYEERKKRGSS